MKHSKTSRVTIDVYDKNGEIRAGSLETVGYEELRRSMLIALEHDGIPVVRRHAKHETVDVSDPDMKLLNLPKIALPLSLRWEFQGVIFSATGSFDDVMKAHEEFLESMFEEE